MIAVEPPREGDLTENGAAALHTDPVPVVYTYRVLNRYPHDPEAFTQGLVYWEGALYEGTGLYGESSLRRVELQTGDVQVIRRLDERWFGEGIALIDDRIIQLTWQEHTAFVVRLDTFEPLGELAYPTEGWGLTTDGQQLIMSDGSSRITFRDPERFEEVRSITVTDRGSAIRNLNELEWIDGFIYANVWRTDVIAIISPTDGVVQGWIDLTGLLDVDAPPGGTPGVLNGIAWDHDTGRLFVTGKLWPALYEIELVPR